MRGNTPKQKGFTLDNSILKAKINEIKTGIERHDRINKSDQPTIVACLEYTLKNIEYIEEQYLKLKDQE